MAGRYQRNPANKRLKSMTNLMQNPVFHLDHFRNLYTPGEDVIFYKQANSINYSYPTLQEAYEALRIMDKICFKNQLHLTRTLKSGLLNHIITLKVRS